MNDHSHNLQTTATRPSSWLFADFAVIALWLAISIGVILGRHFLRPVYLEFGVELPRATSLLLQLESSAFVSVATFAVVLLSICIPSGRARRCFLFIAGTMGALLGTACLWSFIVPLVTISQSLS